MLRIFLVLLVALGAALYFPRSRVVVLETVQPALDPAFRWSTNGEMDRIVRDLTTTDRTAGAFPTDQETFERWLERRYQAGSGSEDAWGTPYRLEILRGASFRVVSAGPDREFGTDDDLFAEGERVSRSQRR